MVTKKICGVIGQPKHKIGDKVNFKIKEKNLFGEICVVDSYGTFFQKEEPSYDIFVETINCLYKHVRESSINTMKKR